MESKHQQTSFSANSGQKNAAAISIKLSHKSPQTLPYPRCRYSRSRPPGIASSMQTKQAWKGLSLVPPISHPRSTSLVPRLYFEIPYRNPPSFRHFIRGTIRICIGQSMTKSFNMQDLDAVFLGHFPNICSICISAIPFLQGNM